jgi:hypothetical protein
MTFLENGEPHWVENDLYSGEAPIEMILRIIKTAKPSLAAALENPVQPGKDEAETVRREWRHFQTSTRQAHRLFKSLDL